MTCWEIILIALSLSIDTLAVTVSSSLTLKKVSGCKALCIALVFGFIQAFLLFIGWAGGTSILSLVYKLAKIIGFLTLLYIGGAMIKEACCKKESEPSNLNGPRAIVLAGVVTSIDAAAVGVSFAMSQINMNDLWISLGSTFLITFLAALFGICCGSRIGQKFGKPAKIIGGIVLVIIGIRLIIP